MGNFQSVTILLPTLNETFSFIKTVEIILEECDHKDIKEFIAIVCDRTLKESLEAIEKGKAMAEEAGIREITVHGRTAWCCGSAQSTAVR